MNKIPGSASLDKKLRTLRGQVAAAEERLKSARKAHREAKQRRREVKRVAQKARKLAKQRKAELARLLKSLAEVGAKLAVSGRTSALKPPKRRKPTAKRPALARKKSKPTQPKAKPARTAQPVRVRTQKPIRRRARRTSEKPTAVPLATTGLPNQVEPQPLAHEIESHEQKLPPGEVRETKDPEV
jgi:hypothetical protein